MFNSMMLEARLCEALRHDYYLIACYVLNCGLVGKNDLSGRVVVVLIIRCTGILQIAGVVIVDEVDCGLL